MNVSVTIGSISAALSGEVGRCEDVCVHIVCLCAALSLLACELE